MCISLWKCQFNVLCVYSLSFCRVFYGFLFFSVVYTPLAIYSFWPFIFKNVSYAFAPFPVHSNFVWFIFVSCYFKCHPKSRHIMMSIFLIGFCMDFVCVCCFKYLCFPVFLVLFYVTSYLVFSFCFSYFGWFLPKLCVHNINVKFIYNSTMNMCSFCLFIVVLVVILTKFLVVFHFLMAGLFGLWVTYNL